MAVVKCWLYYAENVENRCQQLFRPSATGGGEENFACQKASKKSTSVLVTVLMQLESSVMSSEGSWFSSKAYREKEQDRDGQKTREGKRERHDG